MEIYENIIQHLNAINGLVPPENSSPSIILTLS